MAGNLEAVQPLFGIATGKLEGRETSALLPFVFRFHAMDPTHLAVVTTDFHDHTWHTVRTVEQLDDLRDETGIGGSWSDFLAYLRDAFLSDNVTLWLGGPASAVGGYGATSAKVTAQKSRGTPRISMKLTKLSGSDANDAIGDIGVQICRKFQMQSMDLAAEKEHSLKLSATLEAEKATNAKLQSQVDSMGFVGKKKWRSPQYSQSVVKELDILSSQLPSTDLATTSTTGPSDDVQKLDITAKAKQARSKVRVAPTSLRAKRRGTAIGGEE
ncbi:hypothetical protein O6H91_09G051500 [Diphasiastrum complanatum]|uniref:Uncharacterized protein n=1 Tax=Diphasiastrum complanatum TaxID=34168 RepID=A0ACC2CP92_DIPCM|nr:hypothetical protein O6H91_09G051500 [Diphasiastrum complanatum]